MDEVDVEPESEGFPQPEASSKDNNLQVDFHKESVVHDDDTSKAAVKAKFHQSVDVISIDPVIGLDLDYD
ncbi:hypothetical protein L195_g030054 [Trifolium pratense]|uniref:Uncharacterized protein n=1 Tax=Trifolium pratense TaxID=57577 RepID=A0A2K3L6H7_TRIPR|nr:hypothetical protein L195_g030054 [Trifolium pratense]